MQDVDSILKLSSESLLNFSRTSKLDAEVLLSNVLKKNIVEAVEQCGGTFIPEITPVSPLSKVIEELPEDRMIIFCDESLESKNISESLLSVNSEKVALLVGPEGGFSVSERNLLRTKRNVLPVSLGNRILRAETAAVIALTMWHGLVGDWHKRVDHQNYES